MSTVYTNNRGSRWIGYQVVWSEKYQCSQTDFSKKQRIRLKTKSGKVIERSVIVWELFGNEALAHINYKGKRIRVSRSETLED